MSPVARPRVGLVLALALAFGLAAALAVWLAASLAGSDDPGLAAGSHRPTPGPRASAETPTTSPSPRRSVMVLDPGIEPADLPRPPGSMVVAFEEGTDGLVQWSLIEYLTRAASLDEVRAHYRGLLRDGGWLVGDVEYADGGWSFAASMGVREVQLEIAPADGSVRTTVFVSDLTTPSIATRPSDLPDDDGDDGDDPDD